MLNTLKLSVKASLISIAVIVLAGFFPVTGFADSSTNNSSDSSSSSCTPPVSGSPGVHTPVGADAAMYTYQCSGPYAGMWTSAYYVYDPTTQVTTPLVAPTYTYDPTTGEYDYVVWVYNAPHATYDSVTESTSTPPVGATVVGAPTPPTPTNDESDDSTGNSGTNTGTDADSNGLDSSSNDSSNLNGQDNNTGTTTDTTNVNGDDTTNAGISNVITSQATSGSALTLANTTSGDTTSGDAQAIANIVNLLQSSDNALGNGNNVVTFVDNIDGNVDGNLLLDPADLTTVQPADGTTTGSDGSLTVNSQDNTNAAINNNVDVDATSGDATASENTSTGDTASGSAQAIADVVNMIDTALTDGNSFVGIININGNLNGNIEVPADFVNELLADNVPTVSIATSSNTDATNTTNNNINNNVTANAQSGDATESENTSAGNTTTGNASTNITAFNLTGSNVIGSNDLLVFVNVLGQWVGMIINAPAGTDAAEFGGGITSDTTNTNTDLNNNTNAQINNNIDADATSGNATESENTSAGNTSSGNADTAVNLLNVENSTLSLANWFGILFINVFGTWDGNFTIANPINNTAASTSTADSTSTSSNSKSELFRFVPSNSASDPGYIVTPLSDYLSGNGADSTNSAVLAAKTVRNGNSTPVATTTTPHSTAWKTYGIIGGIVVLYIIGDAIITNRRRSRLNNLSK